MTMQCRQSFGEFSELASEAILEKSPTAGLLPAEQTRKS